MSIQPLDAASASKPAVGHEPRTLPSRVYLDPAIHAQESGAIFARTWQYACHVEKLRAPGDFFTAEVAGESIILIRAEDGALNGFYNVCAHRAARLVTGEGCRRRLSCPYHGWTYDTSGRLVAAPNARHVTGFDISGWRLAPVRVEEFHGLVFVNLDAGAPPLADVAPGLIEELRDYAPDLPRLTFAHRTEATIAANWKVVIENFSECYHCQLVHPGLTTGVVDPETYRVLVRGICHRHTSRARTGTARAYDFDAAAAPHGDEFGAWWLWPNFALQTYPGGAVHVWKWTPLDAGRTHVAVDWYLAAAEPADWERELIEQHASTTFAEDIPIVESVQQGLASRAYETGPLMIDEGRTQLSEHPVAAIQDLWRAAMGGD